ncbi:MAG: hypothetical protein RJB38_2329, partial [Pseudomonadota bacterium]
MDWRAALPGFLPQKSVSKSCRQGLALGAALFLSSCSLGLFSDGKDAEVLAQKPYRPDQSLCSSINIRTNEVSVPQFRELLGCLNSNGSLAEIQKLADRMSDAELLPIVRVGNEQLFKNPIFLYQFEKTFTQWVAEGLIDQSLDDVGGLIRNERWVRAMLALMAKADSRLYSSMQIVARELSPERVEQALRAVVALAESPAFRSLQESLRHSPGGSASTNELGAAILAYFRAQRSPGRVDVDRRLLQAFADGSLFRILDDFSVSLSAAGDLRETVAQFSALSNLLMARAGGGSSPAAHADLLHELMRLTHGMHAPIACLKGTQVLPDGVMFLLREIAARSTTDSDRFLRRDNLLNLSFINSFCDYPEALSKHYSAFQRLASTDALFTAVEFSKAFYRNDAAGLLVDTLGGRGSGPGIQSSLMSPVEELLPALSELSSRGGFEDLYLLAASIRVSDRPQWQSLAEFLVRSRSELQGASIYDVLADAIVGADQTIMADLLEGFGHFIDQPRPVFAPAARSLRRSLLMNNVHPVLDFVLGLLNSPEQNRDFFEAIFRAARQYPQEFEQAIRLLGEMTRESDARLKDVISATIRVFSKFAARGESAGVVEAREVPLFDPAKLRAHSWSKGDLKLVPPKALPEWQGCGQLSPTARIDRYESADHDALMAQYLQCVNADGNHSDLVRDVFEYLRAQKTSTGRPLLHHWIDGLRSFQLSAPAIREAVRGAFDLYDEGVLFRIVDLLPWWLSPTFTGAQPVTGSSLISPLIDWVGEVVRGAPESLARAQKFAGRLLEGDSAPGALAFTKRLIDSQINRQVLTDTVQFPMNRFSDPLWKYECLARPADQLARAD